MYKLLIRPLFFKIDPETIHHFVFKMIKQSSKLGISRFFIKKTYGFSADNLEKELFGLKFKNPVGLAAGFDKNAVLFNELSNFGFGFIEIGTVTPKPQGGNPKKRLFRLKKDKALINRMGFNNDGVDAVVERLKNRNTNIIIGGNIGKNKATPNEKAADDYIICFKKLYDYVDYFVVNVSSPNTPGLRALQEKEPLTNLLNELQEENKKHINPKPILLKIAPDLNDNELLDIIDIVKITKIQGVISTNTTIDRSGLETSSQEIEEIGMGGLSGRPLKSRSTEVIRFLSEKSNKAFAIIGVGGIETAEDAKEKLDAGADLIQVFSGYIYEGPSMVKRINKYLSKNK
ncbi:MAG: quinone-dependent dihydroorotate dehydrogenase [Flavobacteriaceae bacterium]|nr:quinone-dependent dihydroorotate dehydrogenase [Flavobacteriaceae bacterium]